MLKFNEIVPTVYAQTSQPSSAGPAAANQPSPFASFLPIVLMFVVFYFLLFRPQKKRLQEEQNFINSLNKGDEIYTKSGLIGTITGLTDKVVTLEVSEGVKVKVLRGQVGGLLKKLLDGQNNSATPAAKA